MMKTGNVLLAALILIPLSAQAQKWEVGGVGGGSFYTSQDVKRPNGSTASVSFSPGLAAGFVLGQDMGRFFGGEIRYSFGLNSAKLTASGGKATFSAQSHALHYDFVIYFRPTGNRVRPYFSVGAGVRQYRGTGTETLTQALSEYALLTKTNDTTPLATAGVGVKVKVGDHSSIRLEIKDFMTPLPKQIFAPNRGSELGGWLHNFAPMVGVSYLF